MVPQNVCNVPKNTYHTQTHTYTRIEICNRTYLDRYVQIYTGTLSVDTSMNREVISDTLSNGGLLYVNLCETVLRSRTTNARTDRQVDRHTDT